jgi:hypothetical protein
MRFASRPAAMPLAIALAIAGAGGLAIAQTASRGVAPVDSSGSLEVSGVTVDVAGKDADSARQGGWRVAQRKGWAMLSQRLTGRSTSLSDSALDSIVTGIVVEDEQIAANRYVARLGVLFSRARAGEILGVGSALVRSPPMLVVPIETSGGAQTVFERATPWQAAWARFRTGNSAVDYVRPAGSGPDSLLLNAGQQGRTGRGWWRTTLEQYGARDVVFPEVQLYRQWPGGPIIGSFRAGYGPDNREVAQFSLRVESSDGLPALLDAGVRRIDEAYQRALRSGILRPDALLSFVPPSATPPEDDAAPGEDMAIDAEAIAPVIGTAEAINIQFDTPSAAAVSQSEAALRTVPGVRSAVTSSLALGGVSVMRVAYDGNIAGLAAALQARGWQVDQGAGTLRIRRAAPSPQPQPAPEPTPGQ